MTNKTLFTILFSLLFSVSIFAAETVEEVGEASNGEEK